MRALVGCVRLGHRGEARGRGMADALAEDVREVPAEVRGLPPV